MNRLIALGRGPQPLRQRRAVRFLGKCDLYCTHVAEMQMLTAQAIDGVPSDQHVIRNIGTERITFDRELAPAYFWGANEQGILSTHPACLYGGFAQPGTPQQKELRPGDEYAIGTLGITRASAGLERFPFAPTGGLRRVQLAPGDFRVGADGVELWTDDGWKFGMGTGFSTFRFPLPRSSRRVRFRGRPRNPEWP